MVPKGTNRQISVCKPPIRSDPFWISKAKLANSPSNFVHEIPRAHTFASGATLQHLGCCPSHSRSHPLCSLRLMLSC